MKKILILVFIIILCGCSFESKKGVMDFYVYSNNSNYEYDDLNIKVIEINNDCVSKMQCLNTDEVSIKVLAGKDGILEEYTLSNVSEIFLVDIDDTNFSLGLTIRDQKTVITVYE